MIQVTIAGVTQCVCPPDTIQVMGPDGFECAAEPSQLCTHPGWMVKNGLCCDPTNGGWSGIVPYTSPDHMNYNYKYCNNPLPATCGNNCSIEAGYTAVPASVPLAEYQFVGCQAGFVYYGGQCVQNCGGCSFISDGFYYIYDLQGCTGSAYTTANELWWIQSSDMQIWDSGGIYAHCSGACPHVHVTAASVYDCGDVYCVNNPETIPVTEFGAIVLSPNFTCEP